MIKRKNKQDAAKIFYYRRPELETAKEKLQFLATRKFSDIYQEFKHIAPDKDHNWINLSDNDFDELLPLANKETKLGKSKEDEKAVFKLFSTGILTSRDEWVYDFDEEILTKKIKYFYEVYEKEKVRWNKSDRKVPINDFIDREIKWTSELEDYLIKGSKLLFNKKFLTTSLYRPYVTKKFYYDKIIIHRTYQMPNIFPMEDKKENRLIWLTIHKQVPFSAGCTNKISDHGMGSRISQFLPFYRYDESGNRLDNITEWGLNQFRTHYKDKKISREDIFHYVYAVLHNPEYRKKYEQNLKRELPRVPFYENFPQWVNWGKSLMNLHINYETVEPYPLERTDLPEPKISKPRLKADKDAGKIIIDAVTTLSGIPEIAWEYRLGTYSALQWILEQYKEKKIKDPTIAEKFDTYRFADYKEHVIDLLMKVCTVSVKTMEIINRMKISSVGAIYL